MQSVCSFPRYVKLWPILVCCQPTKLIWVVLFHKFPNFTLHFTPPNGLGGLQILLEILTQNLATLTDKKKRLREG